MTYVDAFAAAVPNDKREAFRAHADGFAAVFKEYGALQVVDCWGDEVPDGEVTSFPLAVKCQPGETVVFGWMTWPSKEARDQGMAKAMADPRMNHETNPMPFDGKRLIHGGFEMIVER